MDNVRSPRPEGWWHRGARPAALWWLPIFIGVLVLFIMGALSIWLRGLWLTVGQGHAAPNLTGGLENLGMLVTAIVAAYMQLRGQAKDRHAERRDEIARGAAPGPIEPSPPSPDGGGRPGDSQ